MFSLLPGDFSSKSLEVSVRAEVAKTRTRRTLPIMPITAKFLQELLAARHKSWSDSAPVFCTIEGKPIQSEMWSKRLKKYSDKLGVKVTPYFLRHCFALQFLRAGGSAFALQRTLGHSDLSMTKRYVALTEGDLKEQHAKASPLNTLAPQKNRVFHKLKY